MNHVARGFQSAPRPRGRGDRAAQDGPHHAGGFNPRPARAGGATGAAGRRLGHTKCFNPRPARAGGATSTCSRRSLPPSPFQSAPRPRGRGDKAVTAEGVFTTSFNPRPARAGGATRRRTSRRRAGACFNPRPARAGGATRLTGPGQQHGDVSIRAPPARAGRLELLRETQLDIVFQSAPRPRGRGDFPEQFQIQTEGVSIRAPPARAGRLRPGLPTEPQDLCKPFPPTCQLFPHTGRLACQRTIGTLRHPGLSGAARNPGLQPDTAGSRQRVHRIRGSIKSTGFAAPWCSIRRTAVSSRK